MAVSMPKQNSWLSQVRAYLRKMWRDKWSDELRVQMSAEHKRRLELVDASLVPTTPGCYRIMNTSKSVDKHTLKPTAQCGSMPRCRFCSAYITVTSHVSISLPSTSGMQCLSAEHILKHCPTISIQYVQTCDKYTAQWLEIDLFNEFRRDAQRYGTEYQLPLLNRQTPRTEPVKQKKRSDLTYSVSTTNEPKV